MNNGTLHNNGHISLCRIISNQLWFFSLQGLEAEGKNNHEFAWERMASGLPGRAMVVFLSDFLEAEDSLPESLRFSLSSRYECLCLQVLDPDEIDLPDGEAFRFAELEGDREVSTSPPAILEKYKNDMSVFCNDLQTGLSAVSAEFESLSTDQVSIRHRKKKRNLQVILTFIIF